MPPQVRELNDLQKLLQQSVAPQKQLIDQDLAGLTTAGRAQEEGLAAKQQNAFGQIEQGAQNKGMFFSGFGADRQAEYTADTYLPALAELQATIAASRSNLLGKKADIDTDVFNKAFDTREGDVAAKRSWDSAETDRRWQEKQAELDRSFKATESAKDRAAAAAQVSSGNASSAQEALDGDRKAISSELFQVTGDDGFVSPGSYAKAKNAWVSSGYDSKSFDSNFSAYRNPGNKYYKLG